MFDKEKSAKEESVKEKPLLNITVSSGSNTTVSTESDHDINHVSDKEMFQDDQWADRALAQMIRDGKFEELKAIYNSNGASDTEVLFTIALSICDSNYRDKHKVTNAVARYIVVEAVEQLDYRGEDTTGIIKASDWPQR